MQSPQHPTLHLWTPGLFDFKGGIQTYSRFLLEGLQTLLPQAQIRVFCLHDRPQTLPVDPPVDSSVNPSGTVRYTTTGQVPARWRSLAFAAQTTQAALADSPDLIITTHINFTPIAQGLKRWRHQPYWGIAHGFEAWQVEKPSVRRGVAGADKILAVSGFTRDRMTHSQALSNLSILPNTFDVSRFQVAPKPQRWLDHYGLRPDQPVILTVNRLAAAEPFHSYDQILAALPALRQAIPKVHYLIVGKGDDRPRLEALIAEHHLQDSVTLAGFVADADLPDHYALCDVFAMPSQLEGFGIVYLEAMACGKPVLAGLDGAQDALKQGELGVLVNPQDIAAITTHLIDLLSGTYPNPLLYQPQALRQRVIEAFGPQAFQQQLAQHLATTLPPNLVPHPAPNHYTHLAQPT